MSDAEEKLRNELRNQFGESADKHLASLKVKSVNLGGATPLEHVARGGSVQTAIGSFAPQGRGC